MRDYTHLYRDELRMGDYWPESWDVFLSAYNPSERVTKVFEKVRATQKHWLLHHEYDYTDAEHPTGTIFKPTSSTEADCVLDYVSTLLSGVDFAHVRFCVDISGFMRPHMMFLIKYLVQRGMKSIDVIYSEPLYYAKRESTPFSLGSVQSVRQVAGFEGTVNNDTSRDLLIVGSGYETNLIAEVAEDKDKANKVVLYGLPSLVADMYQQNVWSTARAADALGEASTRKFFAPANDPFVTATVLSDILARQNSVGAVTNLYLSPLATKAQALGFVLFYIEECAGKSASIIFPFSARYSRETGEGVSRVWKYRLEFPAIA